MGGKKKNQNYTLILDQVSECRGFDHADARSVGGLMLQLGFVVGDLVYERSDVCGKSGGCALLRVAFHSPAQFFLMSVPAAICLTCKATNPSSR